MSKEGFRIGSSVGALIASVFLCSCSGGGGSSPEENESEPPEALRTTSLVSAEELQHCLDTTKDTFFRQSSTRLGLCYSPEEAQFFADQSNTVERDLADFTGGLAYSDIDNDGSIELYVAHGGGVPGYLFTYKDGAFQRIDDNRGIRASSMEYGGYFVDLNADGWDDFVSVQHGGVEIFFNQGDGTFVEETEFTRIFHHRATVSLAASDYDLDGDLDLVFAHWGTGWRTEKPLSEYLWANDGRGRFRDRSPRLPILPTIGSEQSFTPTFADINSDGYPDLLVAGDFDSSQVFLNDKGDRFIDITTGEITDENGMGAAVADYDRDGDLDWFVSSIYGDPSEFGDLYSGNRMYRNSDGKGTFEDVTSETNLRIGGWGWGSCFADFDNDGYVDLFHTNGSAVFPEDRSVLYMGSKDGTFRERSAEFGIDHVDQGRGVLCVDFDDDGDIDVFVANNRKSPSVFTNVHASENSFIKIRLTGLEQNRKAIGARVTVTTSSGTQVQEVQLGTGYLAQGPSELHFGLGEYDTVEQIRVKWPNRLPVVSELSHVSANQTIEIEHPQVDRLQLHVIDGNGSGTFDAGEMIPIEAAEPEHGYVFSHWSSNVDANFEDRTASHTFVEMPTKVVVVTANYLPLVGTVVGKSVARLWNEVLLQAVRYDYARPTVHARNLFHISAAMYDAWSVHNGRTSTWLLGKTSAGFNCSFDLASYGSKSAKDAQVAVSFAAYRLIHHRFSKSPGRARIARDADTLMDYLQFDGIHEGVDYSTGDAVALGNYVAECYENLGELDGANESNEYRNNSYLSVNAALQPEKPGNPNISDLNRWQPLLLREFIDQSGNPIYAEPEFIGAEWGSVAPFSLTEFDAQQYVRDGYEYSVYHDPGAPPYLDDHRSDAYKWGFGLVSKWSSHLDPADGVEIDIAPSSVGNLTEFPRTLEEYKNFYENVFGEDSTFGHDTNPVTGSPYEPQFVKRGDYTRVLAEFWADGPDSETPPGHWFVILNEVSDHQLFVRRWEGKSQVLDPLEWDVKAYFVLGAGMHDAAIAAWSIKGWYDYIRPISAIRAMTDRGQSSSSDLASYHTDGIQLHDGLIEVIGEGDELAGANGEHIGKIKLYAWRGPEFISDPRTDVAGVGWIRAEKWWPYQRPTFVTPPFAGYVSGHSTYSRAAAEILTRLTGSAYFPGGMSEFRIPANVYLKFERGPSESLILQWATYRDAADQCSLSRIWGGIHPPADDIPGRIIGRTLGIRAYELAVSYVNGNTAN